MYTAKLREWVAGQMSGYLMSSEGTSLDLLGWGRQGLAYPELKKNEGIGRVVVEHRGAYELMGPSGLHEAILATSSREQAEDPIDYPAVGDWVIHTLDPIDNRRLGIIKVLPRRSRVLRRASGTAPVPQVVGSNIDVLGIVVSTDQEIDEHLIERYLVTAEGGGVSPVIIINKSDLGGGAEIQELLIRRGVQCPIFLTNAHRDEELGEVAKLLSGGATLALTGASGVGKSTLVNQLVGDPVLATGSVDSEGAGRHTTVRRELLVAAPGVVIDTPGLREVQIWDDAGLEAVFNEIAEAALDCKFADCSHRDEPGCAVTVACADQRISSDRLVSYLALCRELQELSDEIEEYQRSQRRRRDSRST